AGRRGLRRRVPLPRHRRPQAAQRDVPPPRDPGRVGRLDLNGSAAHAVLFAGIVCVSTSGPVYVMSGMDPYAVVFCRMAVSAPLFLAWSALRRELRVAPGEGGRLVVGALALALHFVLWIKAFQLTDYASNLLLLVAQPVMAAAVAVRRGERTA